MESRPSDIRKSEFAFLVRGNTTSVLVTTDNGNRPSNHPSNISNIPGKGISPSSQVTQHPQMGRSWCPFHRQVSRT